MSALDVREADVTATEVANGEPRLQLSRGGGNGLTGGVAMWGPWHYYAVPNPADNDGAPGVMYLLEGNRARAFAGRDLRYSGLAGELKPGDWMFASRGESRLIHKAEKDSITAYTVNQKTERSMMAHLDGEAGVIQVVNGNARVDITDDSITLAVNGGGSIIIDKTGVHIGGNAINLDSGSGTIGLIGGTIRPTLPSNGVLYGTAVTPLTSTTWTIAT